MPEQWSCGNCPLVVDIPDEQTCRPAYIDTILRIREHRFGHIADAFAESNEAVMGLCEDDPEPDSMSLLNPEVSPGWTRPVTNDDVGRAVKEAEAIVRGRRA